LPCTLITTHRDGTQPSTVAEYCKIQLDRRYINSETIEDVEKEIQEFINELKNSVPGLDVRLKLMECGKMISNVQPGPGVGFMG